VNKLDYIHVCTIKLYEIFDSTERLGKVYI